MFKFTIRELLILTVTAGLAVGWWIDHSRLVENAKNWEAKAVFVANSMLGTEYELGKPWELEPAPSKFKQPYYPVTTHATSTVTPQTPAMNKEISEERAVEIVRALILKDYPTSQFEYKVSVNPKEYRVFVEFYILDDNGERRYYPGGHAMYVLSKSGDLLKRIGGL